MRTIYFSLFALLLALPLGAQNPTQLADIFPGEEDSSPNNFFQFGDKMLFRAETPNEGVEPWITDGTPEGTMLLLDINTDASLSRGNSNPDNFTEYNGLVYFKARSAGSGDELWVTDGTPEGTRLFFEIQAGDGNSNPFDFIEYDGKLYFTANDGVNSSELWVTDGTVEGTQLVVDIRPGNSPGNPNFKTIFNGKLFFTANDGTNGNELWMSDGTAAGTMLVKDIREGSGSSTPSQYFAYNGELYFRANDGDNGSELWKTDGTTEGTVLVRDIDPDGSSGPGDFFQVGNKLFFVADDGTSGDELWVTEGDSATTVLFADFNAGGDGDPREIVELLAGRTYVFVADTSDADNGAVIYALNTDETGDIDLDDLGDFLLEIGGTDPEDLVFSGSNLYFSYDSPATGRELATVGVTTDSDPFVFPDIAADAASADIDDIFLFGNFLVFEATDTTSGDELWILNAETAYMSLIGPDDTVLASGDTLELTATSGFENGVVIAFSNLGTDTTLLVDYTFDALSAPFVGNLTLELEDDELLPPNPGNQSLALTFSPTSTGEFLDSFRLLIPSATGPDEWTIFVRGRTVAPLLEVTESGAPVAINATLDFNDVPERTDSTRNLVLTNNGEGLLVISDATLAVGTEFSVVPVMDTLAMGESVNLPVTFTSGMLGTYLDTLTIVTSDEGNDGNFVVNLSGVIIVNRVVEQGLLTRAVFPNPVANTLTVELAAPLQQGTWRIYNVNGQQLNSGVWPAGQLTHQIPTNALPSGIFHLEVSSGTRRFVARVMKK